MSLFIERCLFLCVLLVRFLSWLFYRIIELFVSKFLNDNVRVVGIYNIDKIKVLVISSNIQHRDKVD